MVAAPIYEAEHSPNISIIEQVLAIGLHIFIDYLQGVVPHGADETFHLPLHQLGTSIHECDRDALTWWCMMLVATIPEDINRWPWINRALAKLQIEVRSSRRVELSKTFLPVPGLPEMAPADHTENTQFQGMKKVEVCVVEHEITWCATEEC